MALPREVLEACPEAASATKTARLGTSAGATLGETFLLLIDRELLVLSRASTLDPFAPARLSEPPRLEVGIETSLLMKFEDGTDGRLRVAFTEEVAIASLLSTLASQRAMAALTKPTAAIVKVELPAERAPSEEPTLQLPPARGEIVVRDATELRAIRTRFVSMLETRSRSRRAELLEKREHLPPPVAPRNEARPKNVALERSTPRELTKPTGRVKVFVWIGVMLLIASWLALKMADALGLL